MSAEGALRDGNTADFDLIETMRWEPGQGFLRFERHLARLYGSAEELGFACDPQRVGEVLANTVGAQQTALRTRLVLQRNGEVRLQLSLTSRSRPTRSGGCSWRGCGSPPPTRCCATRPAGGRSTPMPAPNI